MIDELWCSSEPARKSLLRILTIDDARIRIVRYGRAIAKMAPNLLSREEARRKLSIPQDAILLGTVSRIDKGKGTIGALINDSQVYDDLKRVTGQINRNRILKNLIRKSISDSEEPQKDQ